MDNQPVPAERPLINIEGECVALGPIRRELVPLYQKWDTDFTVLGLHNVMLTMTEYNLAGIHAYEKAGFRQIGRRRQVKWMKDRLWDVIYMDCLSTEFESPVLGRLFVPDKEKT